MRTPDPIDEQIKELRSLIADLKSAADRVAGVVTVLSEAQRGVEATIDGRSAGDD